MLFWYFCYVLSFSFIAGLMNLVKCVCSHHTTPRSHRSALRSFARSQALGKPLDRAGELFACLSSERLLGLLDCLMVSHTVSV